MINRNVIVLDLETARSADDCRHCGEPKEGHLNQGHFYEPIGWHNRPALGLSIGGYYSYRDERVWWFDEHTLDATVTDLVDQQPLMVSFNGIAFDFVLMRGILRRRVEAIGSENVRECLTEVCDDFKALASASYDILAEVWRSDPSRKFKKGLNSLDAISQANGLGAKLSHGAQAPRDWAVGKHADVMNYCQDDILKTRALFEMLRANEGTLRRGDGSEIHLRWVDEEGKWHETGGW